MNAGTTDRGGFNLLETTISIAVLSLFLSALGGVLTSTADTSAANIRHNRHARDLHATVHRVADELLQAGNATLFPIPDPLLGSETIDYRQVDGFAAGAIIWSDPRRIDLQESAEDPDNGLDDDGDGLVDERRVVLTIDPGGPAERSVTLADDVPELLEGELENGVDDNGNGLVDEAGLTLSMDGGVVTVHLTLQKTTPHGVTFETAQTSIVLRN